MSADADTDDAPVADGATDAGTADGAPDRTSGGPERSRSVGPLVALGLALAVLVVSIGVAVVGGDDVSATAVRVDSSEVSQKTFNQELDELGRALRDSDSSTGEFTDAYLPADYAAALAQVYVMSNLLRDHVTITDADRKGFLDENRAELSQYTRRLRDQLVDVNLMSSALVAERGDEGAARFIRRLARQADVHVDPRYGFWNPVLIKVCPPVGCAGASTSGG